jgi:hypothetical protein
MSIFLEFTVLNYRNPRYGTKPKKTLKKLVFYAICTGYIIWGIPVNGKRCQLKPVKKLLKFKRVKSNSHIFGRNMSKN